MAQLQTLTIDEDLLNETSLRVSRTINDKGDTLRKELSLLNERLVNLERAIHDVAWGLSPSFLPFAPTGRKVIAQGNALWVRTSKKSPALKGRNSTARKSMRRRTQGGASLCPGLSHFAPLGRGNKKTPGAVRLLITLWNVFRRFRLTRSQRRRI